MNYLSILVRTSISSPLQIMITSKIIIVVQGNTIYQMLSCFSIRQAPYKAAVASAFGSLPYEIGFFFTTSNISSAACYVFWFMPAFSATFDRYPLASTLEVLILNSLDINLKHLPANILSASDASDISSNLLGMSISLHAAYIEATTISLIDLPLINPLAKGLAIVIRCPFQSQSR